MAKEQPTDIQVVDQLRPEVLPRARWADDLDPVGPVTAEEDVRFILIHHTASGNDYGRDETADKIRSFYRLHVGPQRGWSDVAYNFLVDRFGRIWEGRAGSLERAVRGDASGGSQGFAQLCALIGDHRSVPVGEEAATALIRLVAWLGERHGIDTTPGSKAGFVSRGSDRWPPGTEVITSTIAGHRDMSLTSCPGDAAYALITGRLPASATELRRQTGDRLGVAAGEDPSDGAVSEGMTGNGAAVEAGRPKPGGDQTGGESRSIGSYDAGSEARGATGDDPFLVGLGIGGTAALAGLGALLALRRRRSV